jgi:3-phosphoshikimate 1-carboxyvinyltransferase
VTASEVQPATRPLRGRVAVPTDKSISHRAAVFGALASGTTVVRGFSPAGDCASTLSAIRSLGARVLSDGDAVRIEGWGEGGPAAPAAPVDCGRSGTTMRLLCGALAPFPAGVTLTGDEQLLARPMERVAEPLRSMGATVTTTDGGRPPIDLRGGALRGIGYEMPMASAQVKSAVLLAGLGAVGSTTVREPVPTRDHTERLLAAMGARVTIENGKRGRSVVVEPGPLRGVETVVPGDLSSAAPLLAAAAIVPGSDLTVVGVGLNSTRAGLLAALARMGAPIDTDPGPEAGGEPRGDVRIRHAPLAAVSVGADDVPAMVDELPLLGLLATQAEGTSVIQGAAELRVKESDRIAVLLAGLRSLGASVEELPDGFAISGPTPLSGGDVDSAGDHRMAMVFAVAALIAAGPVRVRGMESVGDSFPGFLAALEDLR